MEGEGRIYICPQKREYMKKLISLILVPFLVLSVFILPAAAGGDDVDAALTYYVSSDGTGDGSESSPFGSIGAARDAIRELKKTSGLPGGGIDVIVEEGVYSPDSTIAFTEEDSGTESCPIRYIAAEKGEVYIRVSKTVDYSDFTALTTDESARILDSDAAGKVLKLDLTKYGIDSSNISSLSDNYRFDLSVDGTALKYAEYPNGEYFRTPYEITDSRNTKLSLEETSMERIKTWANLDDVYMYVFTTYEWATAISQVYEYDEETGVMTVANAGYGYGAGSRYRFINVMEEIDLPGEYYLDRDALTLYAYLPEGAENSLITVNVTDNILVTMNNCSYITLSGFDLSGSRSEAIRAEQCTDITLDSLKIYNIGHVGIRANGYRITIQNCDISGTGMDAIMISGGDRQTLTPSENLIYNNYIHDWSIKGMTYHPAVRIDGVGVTVSHNEMCNSLHFAIHYHGNDHIIEYNFIHDVVTDSSDAGAIYAGRQYTYYGDVIRYNYFRDIGNKDMGGAMAIYYDDALSGQTAYGNIINRVYGKNSFAVMIGGGHSVSVTNNIFIDIYDNEPISDAMSIDSRARTGYFDPAYWAGDPYQHIWQFEEVPYTEGIWAEKYPDLAKVVYDKETLDEDSVYTFFNPSFLTVKNNALYCSGNGPKVMTLDTSGFAYRMPQQIADSCVFENNYLIARNLNDFVDPDNDDYNLKEDAALFSKIPEFVELPFDEMGLIDDTPEMTFTDVKEGQWFYEAVEYAFVNGLMNGTSEDKFSPNDPMTRAMLVTVLWRAEGSPSTDVSDPFTDLKQDWYRDAVAWAYANEIVNGMTKDTFSPNGKITREQIATIIYRYAQYKGRDTSGTPSLSAFPDANMVHDYASDAVSWAVSESLIAGTKSGSKVILDPRGNATRAQVATILQRYLEN